MDRGAGHDDNPVELDGEAAWSLLRRAASGEGTAFASSRSGEGDSASWLPASASASQLRFDASCPGGWSASIRVQPEARELLDQLAPLCAGERGASIVFAHLGQSLDGRIATRTGSSQFITGEGDLTHTHRLRALSDAVVVGARTVVHDDPRLTTRLVSGAHPTRVILDPKGRLGTEHGVFSDGLSSTLLVRSEADCPAAGSYGATEILGAPVVDGYFVLDVVLHRLRERGLRRIFVEGGGVTVSRFLEAGLLDRLHVCVAPMILGSGLPAFAFAPIDVLSQAMRFCARHFSLGPDVLFDCDPRSTAGTDKGPRNDQ